MAEKCLVLFTSQAHPQGVTHHERKRDTQRSHQANRHWQIDEPHFIFHARNIVTGGRADAMGCNPKVGLKKHTN